MNPLKKLFDNVFSDSIKDSLNKIDMDPALPIFRLYEPNKNNTEIYQYDELKDSLTDWLFCDN